MKNFIDYILDNYEKSYTKYIYFILSIVLSIITMILKNYIDITSLEILSNLSLTYIGINTAFLTFFITLKESVVFKKLREYYSHLYKELHLRFKNNIIICVIFNILIFLILSFKECDLWLINLLVGSIFFYLVFEIIIGSLYLLDVTVNLITKD